MSQVRSAIPAQEQLVESRARPCFRGAAERLTVGAVTASVADRAWIERRREVADAR